MCRLSNLLVGILNSCTLIFGLIAIAAAINIRMHGGSDCQRLFQDTVLTIGIFFFVISLLGLIGSCCRLNSILYIYLIVMFLLIIGLTAFTIFTLLVTNKGVGLAVSGKGYKEYRLGDYSHWLQNYVGNQKNWLPIRTCLVDSPVCRSLADGAHQTLADFSKKKLSSVQSGCCKPPSYCGFAFKNATVWVASKTGPAVADSDCKTWSNRQETLCYDCKACKGGVLANFKRKWRQFAIYNAGALVFITILYSIGCCAVRSNRFSRKYNRYGAHF